MAITFTDGWREDQVHQDLMIVIQHQKEREVFQMLSPRIEKDGNQWCVIWGQMPENYIAGFGDTLYQAVASFYSEYCNSKA